MSSNELLDTIDGNFNNGKCDGLDVRSNTMAHVCWHRNWSISVNDYEGALTVRTLHRKSRNIYMFILNWLSLYLDLPQWLFITQIQE